MANVSISEITQEITSPYELDGNELLLISDVSDDTYTSKKCNLGNIKSYVGPTVNNQDKTIINNGTFVADSGYTGLGTVTVNVSCPEIRNQEKTTSPTTSSQVVTPDSGYTGLSKVTVNAVTNSIDSNISAGNIKNGVTILGVTGTLIDRSAQVIEIAENGEYIPSGDFNCFSKAIVNINKKGKVFGNQDNLSLSTDGNNALTLTPNAAASCYDNCEIDCKMVSSGTKIASSTKITNSILNIKSPETCRLSLNDSNSIVISYSESSSASITIPPNLTDLEIRTPNGIAYTQNSVWILDNNLLFESSNPGEYDLSLNSGTYKVVAIGGYGGECYNKDSSSLYLLGLTSGGSAMALIGTMNITKNTNLKIVVGKSGRNYSRIGSSSWNTTWNGTSSTITSVGEDIINISAPAGNYPTQVMTPGTETSDSVFNAAISSVGFTNTGSVKGKAGDCASSATSTSEDYHGATYATSIYKYGYRLKGDYQHANGYVSITKI